MSGINEKLLNVLNTETYTTAGKLGEKLLYSEKTIRNYIRELDEFLQAYGARIETKHGKGYRLVIQDEKLFCSIYQGGILKDEIPTSAEERVDFIIAYLLCHSGYVQMEELMSILCVSDSTLAADLRRIKQYLKEYGVRLEIRTRQGIRAVGSEFALRSALADYVMKRGMIAGSEIHLVAKEKEQIFSIIADSLSELDVSMSEISMQNLTIHLYVAIKRIRGGMAVQIPEETHQELRQKFSLGLSAARRICERLEAVFQVSFSEEELDYVVLYLAGNRVTGRNWTEADNIVISPRLRELVDEMLQYVYVTMKMDLRNNFSLIMALAKHMIAMEIRIRYHIELKNPILDEIKTNYSRAYVIATQAANMLENYYHKKISGDEIGYLAIIFNLCLEDMEEREQGAMKKNILIVCAMGKASAQLLAHQYRRVFGKYLNRIEISNRSNLKNCDFSDIDYLLTTTPITMNVPCPVIEIKMFLEDREINYLMNRFSREGQSVETEYYCQELFFEGKSFQTKEEAIRFLCSEIREWKEVPKDFYESVLLREKYGPTDLGEMVAMPHPYGQVTKESFVAVCVLEQPLFWGSHEVQMILLVSLSDQEEPDRDLFLEALSQFIMNRQKVKEVVEEPDYQNFIRLVGMGQSEKDT